MKPHYFEQPQADADDHQLGMAKMMGYVPKTCLLGGVVAMSEVSAGRNPCWGCEGPRERCGGKPKNGAPMPVGCDKCDHGQVLVFSCVGVCECGLCPDVGDCPECRIVLCEHCGTEGRIYVGQYDDERDMGECPACEGTGSEVVEVEQITEDDLENQAAEERGQNQS